MNNLTMEKVASSLFSQEMNKKNNDSEKNYTALNVHGRYGRSHSREKSAEASQ